MLLKKRLKITHDDSLAIDMSYNSDFWLDPLTIINDRLVEFKKHMVDDRCQLTVRRIKKRQHKYQQQINVE